jgi:hypothetical protein
LTNFKVSSDDKTIQTHNSNNNKNDMIRNSTESLIENKSDYEFETISSSCEELFDIPMEELLSSPSWKQIVEQNSFVWP